MKGDFAYPPWAYNSDSPSVVVPILKELLTFSSVLDVGCGKGLWLKEFQRHGISDLVGVDREWVTKEIFEADYACFQAVDLRELFDLGRRFELVCCLEVAEHLEAVHVDALLTSLTRHSDTIVFSAAVPLQGGDRHVNERWPGYWQDRFRELGYEMLDLLRPRLWNMSGVSWWYKQNMFVVQKGSPQNRVLSLIHPDLYVNKAHSLEQIQAGAAPLKSYGRLVVRALSRKCCLKKS